VTAIISIVGPPAAGKTWFREHLAAALDVPAFGIDDERERLTKGPGHGYSFTHDDRAWSNLRARLREPAAILECAGSTARYAACVDGHRVLTIECTASTGDRSRRLGERVRAGYFLTLHNPDYVGKLLAIHGGHPDALIVDTLDPASVARAVAAVRVFLSEPSPLPPPALRTPADDLAPVDALRALPYPLALATLARLEEELGPEAVASLRYAWRFWARPAQLVEDYDNLATIEVFVGERRSGKTRAAVELFVDLVRTGRARLPRIVSATDPQIAEIALDGASGIRTWLPPPHEGVLDWKKSDGFAGVLYLYGTRVVCCSAAAPGQAIGMSRDLTLAEDPAGWIESVGEKLASDAWTEILKSNSEGMSCVIVATTPAGADFIRDMLDATQRTDPTFIRIHDLGAVENNRGNLAPNYLRHTVADLRRKSKWDASTDESPFAHTDFSRMRLEDCPPLVDLAVAIDPSRSHGPSACEVGIVGGGLDARSIVHARHDRSGRLDEGAAGWPAVAWDLAEQLQREHPGASIRFVIESNTGSSKAELLRAEERARRRARGEPGINRVEVVLVKASKNKCERAKPPAMQARLGQVRIAPGLTEVEGQLRTLTPDGKKSDRADAWVHLVRDLAGLSDEKEIKRVATEEEEAEEALSQMQIATDMNAAMQARARGRPTGAPELMTVEGAPPGDSRYAGPPPRSVARAANWRSRGAL
jgi:phage terminase large subunit-like protein